MGFDPFKQYCRIASSFVRKTETWILIPLCAYGTNNVTSILLNRYHKTLFFASILFKVISITADFNAHLAL